MDCGFIPRCALEISNAAEVRIDKIYNLIEACKFGIHDICRTELDAATSLPRFNMPLELGIFLGCRRFGPQKQKSKVCIIFDKERFRFQKFISDISGQDIAEHNDNPRTLIQQIRDWLSSQGGNRPLPGGDDIAVRFRAFMFILPKLCKKLKLKPRGLTFSDLVRVIGESSKRPPPSRSAPSTLKPI